MHRINIKKLIGIICMAFVFTACNDGRRPMAIKSSEENALAANVGFASIAETKKTTGNQKLTKEGDIVFEVEELRAVQHRIKNAVEAYQAYFTFDNEYTSSYRIENTYTIRVPSNHFDALLDEIATDVKHFDKKEILVHDLSEEFVDLEARLLAKKKVELRFISILNKAKEIKDILEVEHQLAKIREEIERVQGRLNYLKDRVSMSTIKLEIYQEISLVEKSENPFLINFKRGWDGFVSVLSLLTALWPFLLLLIAVYLCVMWRKKKRLLS